MLAGCWGLGDKCGAWLSPSTVPAAFHEMCRDEYVMLMTWKKAAAGEIIYNKCPPNASGEGWGGSPQRPPPMPFLMSPSLSLQPEAWSEVGKSTAPTPIPLSSPPAGSASRRCLLSAQGVAYWGLPSFARCISHEYRYLYLSVSVPYWAGATLDLVVGGGSLSLANAHVPWHTYAVPTTAWLCLSMSGKLLLTPQGVVPFLVPCAYCCASAAP